MTLKNVGNTPESNVNNHQFDAVPAVKFRSPSALDGSAINALIKNSPPLDTNSAYCNLLQCSHFAETCVVAESNNQILAWLSAYIPPEQQDHIFIWQVAVNSQARGKGLAKRLLATLLKRKALAKVQYLITTITEDNQASWSLFESFANAHQLNLTSTPHFEKDRHFQGAHETEFLVKIGPFNTTEVYNN